MDTLRFPVGPFQTPEVSSPTERAEWAAEIEAAPGLLRRLVEGASDAQLDTPYRPGGWTARQVIHHMTDSHMNAYVRLRLALTEEEPVIKPYAEDRWAELLDAREAEIGPSLDILDGLHRRWGMLLLSLTDEQWTRAFQHPEMGRVRIDQQTALYAWHSRHHIAHVKAALGR